MIAASVVSRRNGRHTVRTVRSTATRDDCALSATGSRPNACATATITASTVRTETQPIGVVLS